MDSAPLAALTNKQRECLRLVLQHHSSKEIARKLGITADAVDRRLKAAMKTLGVQSRVQAARMLAERESCPATLPMRTQDKARDRVSQIKRIRSQLRLLVPRSRRTRMLVGVCLIGLVLGYFSTPLDDWLRDMRTTSRSRPASGEIALVAIDDRSIAAVGSFPWPRRRLAELVSKVDRLGPKRIFVSLILDTRTKPEDDKALAEAFKPLRHRLILPLYYATDPDTGKLTRFDPLPEFQGQADGVDITGLAPSRVRRRESYGAKHGFLHLPSPAALLGGYLWREGDFPTDFSIDPASIPTVSALDILNGVSGSEKIAGKEVVLAATFLPHDENDFQAPGYGILPGSYFHILGAETLKAGPPFEVPRIIGLVFALALVIACPLVQRGRLSFVLIGAGIGAFAILPFFLEPHLIYLQIVPPMLLLIFAGAALTLSRLWDIRTPPISGRATQPRST